MIYVMSDIHGEKEKFETIMQKIKLRPEDKLYVLGDIIDRGKDGIGILLGLMKRNNVTILMGNHELMMLKATQGNATWSDIRLWYRNYGQVTHDAFMSQPKEMQSKISDFLSRMPLSVEITLNGIEYILVHGAPPELQYKNYSIGITEREFATWTRLRADDAMPKGKIVIFGHTPTEDYQPTYPLSIWHGTDKIGIDCGCGHSHPACRLACLRLDDMQEYYSN